MLVGHATGLDSVYYKAPEEEIFDEYCKAIKLLEMSNELMLRKDEVQILEKDSDLSIIRQNYKDDLADLKKEMKYRFSKIFELIQQNPILINIKPEIMKDLKISSFHVQYRF